MAVNRFGTVIAGSRVVHLKRGSTYAVIGPCLLIEDQKPEDGKELLFRLHTGFGIVTAIARLQTSDPARDARPCAHFILYVAEDGSSWARNEDEFTDGRFVPCDA